MRGTKNPGGKTFNIGIIGSSLTAGHDAFGDMAYPAVLEYQLKPLWETLGVKFEVRNQAQGSDNPGDFHFCMRQVVGEDIDVIMKESCCWNMWQANQLFELSKKGEA